MRYQLRGIGAVVAVVGSGIACTSCAAAADSSEGGGWCAGRVAIIKSRQSRPSGGFGRWRLTPPGKLKVRLRARDGEFRAPARVTFFFCKKKVTKENHSNLRFKDPLARYGSCKIGGAGFAELVRWWSLSVLGTACTDCAAAADSSKDGSWCAGRFWQLSNCAHCGAKHRNG